MDRRKTLIIFGGAWISAALLTWFLYAATKAPHAEKTVACVAATRDLPAGSRLKKSDLRVLRVPERSVPKTAIPDEAAALDRVLLFPVSANETLLGARMTRASGAEGLASTIEPGKRAISVQINDTSGVAGLIQPRSHVDVLFTRPGSMPEALTTTLLEDVAVLAIGRATEVSQNAIDPKASRPQNQAVTLLVTPEEARKLELAKNEGKVSLALRNPLDRSTALDNRPTRGESLDADMRRKPVPNVRDPKVWAGLTGDLPKKKEEPPKPHLVVDVFRGDKHVQEVFQ